MPNPPTPSTHPGPRTRSLGTALHGKVLVDLAVAWGSWSLAVGLLGGTPRFREGALCWCALAGAVTWAYQLPRQHFRYLGFPDFIRVMEATLVLLAGAGLYYAGFRYFNHPIPGLATWFLAAVGTGGGWGLVRVGARAWGDPGVSWGMRRSDRRQGGESALIYGAGHAGLLLAQEIGRRGRGPRILGFLDDDASKWGVTLQGIPVLGGRGLLAEGACPPGVDLVILAIPSASGAVLRELTDRATRLGKQIRIVPPLLEFLGDQAWRPEIREVSIEDLLRRDPVRLDPGPLTGSLRERVVLVSGAGGSIGGELVRQLAGLGPARIVMLGRGENSLWEIERSLRAGGGHPPISVALCDIRNPVRLSQVFAEHRPDIVFHAAAHKHVPFLESSPEEALENNLLGTAHMLAASREGGVGTFVNISTDKAVGPTNVLGASKRLAEDLVRLAAEQDGGRGKWISVRFGNVLGSRGSVVSVFRDQIARGGPVTVTHPEVKRYFMTIPEASRLVLHAGLLGASGKTYVLDMGPSVRIVDLARDMAELAGHRLGETLPLEFVGLRPGEKLEEALVDEGERLAPTFHAKIFEVGGAEPLGLNLEEVRAMLGEGGATRREAILRFLQHHVPTYRPGP